MAPRPLPPRPARLPRIGAFAEQPSTARRLVGGYLMLNGAGAALLGVLAVLNTVFGDDGAPARWDVLLGGGIGLALQLAMAGALWWAGLRILDGDRRGLWVAAPTFVLSVLGGLATPVVGAAQVLVGAVGLLLLFRIRRELRAPGASP